MEHLLRGRHKLETARLPPLAIFVFKQAQLYPGCMSRKQRKIHSFRLAIGCMHQSRARGQGLPASICISHAPRRNRRSPRAALGSARCMACPARGSPRFHASGVALITAAVECAVAVEQLAVTSGLWQSQSIAFPDTRGKVTDNLHHVAVRIDTRKRQQAVLTVVAVEPAKPLRLAVTLPQ